MDNDVKKLGLSMMFVDVSYKAAKKIRNINLQPIVNVLVTISINAMKSDPNFLYQLMHMISTRWCH